MDTYNLYAIFTCNNKVSFAETAHCVYHRELLLKLQYAYKTLADLGRNGTLFQ